MLSTRRRNEHGRINCSTTKIVLAIGTYPEVCRVPVKACFHTPLHRVPRARPRKIQLSLEQIPERRHHRARRSIERLIEAIDELQSRISVVRRHKRRRRSREAHRRRPEKERRHSARVSDDPVPLPIHILDAKARIEQRLIWICCRSRQIVVIESTTPLSFCAYVLIDEDEKLIRIRFHI